MPSKIPPKPIKTMAQVIAGTQSPAEALVPLRKGEKLAFLPFAKIRPYVGHLFHLYAGERLDDMVSSIQQNGILVPLIVQRIYNDPDHDFEMLSGHNRMNAGALAGLDGAFCLVKDGITDGEARMYVIETNLLQRSFSDMLPSEKAAVLAMQYSEMFSQGKRNDIIHELEALGQTEVNVDGSTCGTEFHKLSRDTLGTEYSLTGRMVAAYVRIDSMAQFFKCRLDHGEFPLKAGVSLSFLSPEEQQLLENALADGAKLTRELANRLQKQSAMGGLDASQIAYILTGTPIKDPAPQQIKLKSSTYAPYFAQHTPAKEIERVIGEALAFYFAQHKSEKGGVA